MPKYWPIGLAVLAGAAAMYVGLQTGADDLERWQLAARYTARAGFPFLIATYIGSSLYKLQPGSWSLALVNHRQFFGLGLVTTHSFHLVALINFLYALPEMPPIIGLLPGFAVFAVLYAMALTTNVCMNWKRLHTFGIHLVWLVFTATYLVKITRPDQQAVSGLFAAIAILALLLRIAAWHKTHPDSRAT